MQKNYVCQDNITNFEELRFKKALLEYENGNFFNPVFQIYIYDFLALNSNLFTHLEYKILSFICQQTIAQGRIRWGIGAGDIAYSIGADKRGVKRLRDKLAQEKWIEIRESCCEYKIGLNLDKIMALGKKFLGKKQDQEEQGNESTSGGMIPPLTKKDNIIIKNNNISREEILKRTERLRRKRAKRMSAHSLSRTWKEGCSANPLCTSVHFTITQMDKIKLSSITGNRRCRGKWNRSAEELHEMVFHLTANWDYYFRQLGHKNMPKLPNIPYFVACFKQFYEVWLLNLKDLHPEDSRVEELEKYRLVKKWYNYDFTE